MNQHDPDALTPIDLLLGEGTAAERLALLRQSRVDAALARDLQETARLILRLRSLAAPSRSPIAPRPPLLADRPGAFAPGSRGKT